MPLSSAAAVPVADNNGSPRQIPRQIQGVLSGAPFNWVGDGFRVSNYFPNGNRIAKAISPFLLLDHAAPHVFAPTDARRGVGGHPHRGFETVTLAYDGIVAHNDSAGNAGTIHPGDVQWMTAGSGVLHNEFHAPEFSRTGGPFHMVQLWVNLPAAHKMTKPKYQELPAAHIPAVELADDAGRARVIAGEFLGVHGPASTFTPIELVDLRLNPGGAISFALPEGHNASILVQGGAVVVNGEREVAEGRLILFGKIGETISLTAGADGAMALIMAGEPIDEPTIFYGPFVMNTREQIEQAIRDFQGGAFGELAE